MSTRGYMHLRMMSLQCSRTRTLRLGLDGSASARSENLPRIVPAFDPAGGVSGDKAGGGRGESKHSNRSNADGGGYADGDDSDSDHDRFHLTSAPPKLESVEEVRVGV